MQLEKHLKNKVEVKKKVRQKADGTTVTKDKSGHITEITSAEGNKTVFTRDAKGGLTGIEVQDGSGRKIDVLLTDIVMPQMGGKDLADKLKPLYPKTKVIFVSGYIQNSSIREGGLQPGEFFLQKPFSPQDLAQKIRQILDERK